MSLIPGTKKFTNTEFCVYIQNSKIMRDGVIIRLESMGAERDGPNPMACWANTFGSVERAGIRLWR
jgi:hypothetical protein